MVVITTLVSCPAGFLYCVPLQHCALRLSHCCHQVGCPLVSFPDFVQYNSVLKLISNGVNFGVETSCPPCWPSVTLLLPLQVLFCRLARSRDEWESAMLQNANTKCNGLMPLWGPEVGCGH